MRCLVDANVLLDVVLGREPWAISSADFFHAARSARTELCLSAVTVTTLFYIARRRTSEEAQPADERRAVAFRAIDEALRDFTIVSVGHSISANARTMPGPDFEDNGQIASAIAADVQLLVTRNPRDFTHSPIPIVSPADAIRRILEASV